MPEAIPERLLASFGRRRGRRLRVTKQGVFDTLLPKLEIRSEEMRNWGNEEKNLVAALFPSLHSSIPQFSNSTIPLWLEIGFGGGEHLAHQATAHPGVGIIGCEPYVNGIAGLLKLISPSHLEGEVRGGGDVSAETQSALPRPPHPNLPPQGGKGLSNIRIFTDDARHLLTRLPNACLEKVFILYPDPWPKARHHKRRLISPQLLDELARVMKPGAELRLATDHADYCAWMLERLLAHPAFSWTAKTPDDWLKPWSDWIPTRYEQKRLAGMPTYLTFTVK